MCKRRAAGGRPLLIVEVGPYEILRETINHLYDSGIYCHGLCYPVVPEGEARIRLMVSALTPPSTSSRPSRRSNRRARSPRSRSMHWMRSAACSDRIVR